MSRKSKAKKETKAAPAAKAAADPSDQPSLFWFAFVSPVTATMGLTMLLAMDYTSSIIWSVIGILSGIVGLIFSSKAGKSIAWPIGAAIIGIALASYTAINVYPLVGKVPTANPNALQPD
jgi:hypothetical protein